MPLVSVGGAVGSRSVVVMAKLGGGGSLALSEYAWIFNTPLRKHCI